MNLTFNLLLCILITFVLGRVFRFDRVVFGNFETLMGCNAIIANQLGTVNAEARCGQIVVGAFRTSHFFSRTIRRRSAAIGSFVGLK